MRARAEPGGLLDLTGAPVDFDQTRQHCGDGVGIKARQIFSLVAGGGT